MPTQAEMLTDLMLTVFRVNGRLLEKGDQMVAPLGLTSARWQVLGAVALAGAPLTAPQIADAMGVTRQGAQKQLNKLVEEGLFETAHNPRHERSPLYVLTTAGGRAYAQAIALNERWSAALGRGFSQAELQAALSTLARLHEQLGQTPVPHKGGLK